MNWLLLTTRGDYEGEHWGFRFTTEWVEVGSA